MKKLFSQILSAIFGLWLASKFIQGVVVRAYPESNFFGILLTAQWQMILLLGIFIGLLNYFVKPLLRTFFLPLEIITLNAFSLAISAGLIWVVDKIFDELYVPWFYPLLYTTLIIFAINLVLQKFLVNNNYE